MDNVPTIPGDMSGPSIARGAVDPICSQDEVAGKLEIGGEFWKWTREPVSGERDFRAVQFPRGVFVADQLCSQVHPSPSAAAVSGPICSRPKPAGGSPAAPAENSFLQRAPIENDLLRSRSRPSSARWLSCG